MTWQATNNGTETAFGKNKYLAMFDHPVCVHARVHAYMYVCVCVLVYVKYIAIQFGV